VCVCVLKSSVCDAFLLRFVISICWSQSEEFQPLLEWPYTRQAWLSPWLQRQWVHTHTHTHTEKDTHSHGVSFSDLSTCIGHPHKTFIYKSYDACQDHVLVLLNVTLNITITNMFSVWYFCSCQLLCYHVYIFKDT